MKVVITGAGGFLGHRLAARLLAEGSIDDLLLVDRRLPDGQALDQASTRVTLLEKQIDDPVCLGALLEFAPDAIVHCAAAISGVAEADFDEGMRVNVDGLRGLLEVCRKLTHPPRFVFASSIAVYGPARGEPVGETSYVAPESAYGLQKVIGEQLVNEYHRRGWIDGCSLRIPTVVVRPDRPPHAKAGFLSDLIELPLRGTSFDIPVRPHTRVSLTSAATAISWLIHSLVAPLDVLGLQRQLQMPALEITVEDLAASVEALAFARTGHGAGSLNWSPDAELERMVNSWGASLDFERAVHLGFRTDWSMAELVRSAVEP